MHSFDILVEPNTGRLSVTAMDRDFEHAHDEAEWVEWGARSPLQPLYPGPWLRDLDSVLPVAQTALAARAGADCPVLDSASLYLDDEAPRWQVVDIAFERRLPRTIRLDELRRHAAALGDFPLLARGNRLSVLPVTQAQWNAILALA